MDGAGSRCKIVVVGDTQCGKTALLHVFAKDCYPEVRVRGSGGCQKSQQLSTTCEGQRGSGQGWQLEAETPEWPDGSLVIAAVTLKVERWCDIYFNTQSYSVIFSLVLCLSVCLSVYGIITKT